MHGSLGNMIAAEEAFARMGADVMRWQYCMQPPNQNLLFGFTTGRQIQRKLLTYWNSITFFITYANLAGYQPQLEHLEHPPAAEHPLDQWLHARTRQLIAETTHAYDDFLTGNVLRSFESFLDDVSNWYIRRSRRRFWYGDQAALRSLWVSLIQSVRVIAPVLPFLAEHLWQHLAVPACTGAPRSVFLAGWPEAGSVDEQLLREIVAVRTVCGPSLRSWRSRA